MDEERDLVVFEDDAGNELTMEVLDYLCYEGKEYALLTEYVEDDDEDDDEGEIEVMIMEVVPVGDDQEEFVPIDDDLAEKIMAVFESDEFDDVYEDDEDEE
jgi:tryptophanyl-tRNA synthetase